MGNLVAYNPDNPSSCRYTATLAIDTAMVRKELVVLLTIQVIAIISSSLGTM